MRCLHWSVSVVSVRVFVSMVPLRPNTATEPKQAARIRAAACFIFSKEDSSMKKIAVIMGSDSDWPVVKGACAQLKEFGIPYEAHILSAHRTPAAAAEFAKNARANGFGVLICAAGMAAHLAGAFAGNSTLPVIGIPMKTSDLGGVDSLYSIVQMPSGIPVATVAINGGTNAGILAAKILAVSDPKLLERLNGNFPVGVCF